MVSTEDQSVGHEGEIDPCLYRGLAGIGLFLVSVGRRAKNQRLTEEGAKALLKAKSVAEEKTLGVGFYNGQLGVGYAAIKGGVMLDEKGLVEEGAKALRPVLSTKDYEEYEVVGGVAGAIPAVLQLAKVLSSKACGKVALRMGEFLINGRRPEAKGWSWRTMSEVQHNLVGYAHGASGIAHALLELYSTTGNDRYRYAAEQALAYEQEHYVPEAKNWPDFRHHTLYYHRLKGRRLAKAIDENKLGPAKPQCRIDAWCHGAAGASFVRLRAWELLGKEKYREKAEAAISGMRERLTSPGNFSLCHGVAGNSEALLRAVETLGKEEARREVEEVADEAVERKVDGSEDWQGGGEGDEISPGLMLGKAGVGYFYLGLHDRSLAPPLFLTAPDGMDIDAPPLGGWKTEVRKDLWRFFSITIQATKKLSSNDLPTDEDVSYLGFRQALGETSIEEATERFFPEQFYRWLCKVAEKKSEAAGLLQDVSRPERVRYEREKNSPPSPARQIIRKACRPDPATMKISDKKMGLSPGIKIVQCQYNWTEWLHEKQEHRNETPPAEKSLFAIRQSGDTYHVEDLSPVERAVIEATPVRGAKLVEEAGSSQGEARKALKSLYRRDVIELRDHPFEQRMEKYKRQGGEARQ